MAQIGKYELMEDYYNSLISNGYSKESAWSELLNNYELYKFQNEVDSPQDAQLMNVRAENIEFMVRKSDEMLRSYAKRMGIIF